METNKGIYQGEDSQVDATKSTECTKPTTKPKTYLTAKNKRHCSVTDATPTPSSLPIFHENTKLLYIDLHQPLDTNNQIC